MLNRLGEWVWPEFKNSAIGDKVYATWPKWQDLDKGRLQEVADEMSQLHTDDNFMYHNCPDAKIASWQNQLIDDYDLDYAPGDRVCIDDATPADWDALADRRLTGRGVDTPKVSSLKEMLDEYPAGWWEIRGDQPNTPNFDLRDEQEKALEEMVEQAEELDLYDDQIVHDLTKPLSQQIGGEHYRQGSIQPIEYIHANDMDFFSGNVVKYITRWKYKNGLEDLKKAQHYIELLMEQEYDYHG